MTDRPASQPTHRVVGRGTASASLAADTHQLMVSQWISSQQIYGFRASGHLINQSIDCWTFCSFLSSNQSTRTYSNWMHQLTLRQAVRSTNESHCSWTPGYVMWCPRTATQCKYECMYAGIGLHIPDATDPRWSLARRSIQCRGCPAVPGICSRSAEYPW